MNAGTERTPPLYEKPAERPVLVPALLALMAAAAGAVLFLFNPARFSFYPECYLYHTTGLLCPGCGSLRALHQLLHGHLTAALHGNLLLVVALPLVAWWAGRYILGLLRNKPAVFNVRPAAVWCALAVMLAFGILRNLPLGKSLGLTP